MGKTGIRHLNISDITIMQFNAKFDYEICLNGNVCQYLRNGDNQI